MNTYIRGNVVRIAVTVKDSAQTLVDPDQALAEFYGLDGVLHLPSVTRDGTGLYHYDMDTGLLPDAGRQLVRRRFYTPDADPAQTACEGAFVVTTAGGFGA